MLAVEVHRLARARGHEERRIGVLLQAGGIIHIAQLRLIDVGNLRGVEVLGRGHRRVRGFAVHGELVLVAQVRLAHERPDFNEARRRHEARMVVHQREQVEAALLATPAHLVPAVRAPTLGMPRAAIHPAVLLEVLLRLLPRGTVGELGCLPRVHVVLEHATAVRPTVVGLLAEVEDLGRLSRLVLRVPWHAHGLVHTHVPVGIVDALARRLDSGAPAAEEPASALADARRVNFQPVVAREDDVGVAVVRAEPQVDVGEEIELGHSFPRHVDVAHVHEVARLAHARVQLVRHVVVEAPVPNGVRVGPASPVAVEREALGIHLVRLALEHGLGVRPRLRRAERTAHALGDDESLGIGRNLVAVALGQRRVVVDKVSHEILHLCGEPFEVDIAALPRLGLVAVRRAGLHVRTPWIAVELRLRRAAVAGRLVGVAGDARQDLQRTHVLDGVSVLVGGQLEVDAAVAVQRVDARRPGAHGFLVLRGWNAGDLFGLLHRILAGQLMESIPYRARLVHRAVFERHLHLSGK